MRFPRRKTLNDVVELNITAFMNLMVILVPFLLITAVFSRMTVIELNLPVLDKAQAASEQKLDLALELVVREGSFDIQDEQLGLLHSVVRNHTDNDWRELTQALLAIKKRYPEEQELMLLMELGIPYKTLIQTMDHVRYTQVVQVTSLEKIDLFPVISISDAPALTLATEHASESNDEAQGASLVGEQQ